MPKRGSMAPIRNLMGAWQAGAGSARACPKKIGLDKPEIITPANRSFAAIGPYLNPPIVSGLLSPGAIFYAISDRCFSAGCQNLFRFQQLLGPLYRPEHRGHIIVDLLLRPRLLNELPLIVNRLAPIVRADPVRIVRPGQGLEEESLAGKLDDAVLHAGICGFAGAGGNSLRDTSGGACDRVGLDGLEDFLPPQIADQDGNVHRLFGGPDKGRCQLQAIGG